MPPELLTDNASGAAGAELRRAQQDPLWVRWRADRGRARCRSACWSSFPVVHVFVPGPGGRAVGVYWENLFGDPDTRHSIMLTLTVAPVAVVANLIFGVAAAWAIARFRFPGRTLLTTLIDLPFSVSPVVAGLMFVLIFGLQGYLGPLLRDDGYRSCPTSCLGGRADRLRCMCSFGRQSAARRGLGSAFVLAAAWCLPCSFVYSSISRCGPATRA